MGFAPHSMAVPRQRLRLGFWDSQQHADGHVSLSVLIPTHLKMDLQRQLHSVPQNQVLSDQKTSHMLGKVGSC